MHLHYPEEFKQKVISVFGNDSKIIELLNSGSELLGRYLDDARQNQCSPEEIVAACESMNLQSLYQKAKKLVAIQQLYSEWLAMYQAQVKQQAPHL